MVQPSSPLSPDRGQCYRRYFPRVFAYIYGRVRDTRATEDLTSRVFRRAFAEAHALPDEKSFATWLFATARALLTSRYRRQRRLGSFPCQGAPEHELLQRPEVARLLDHLRRFSLREQDIIGLKFDAQLSNAQIAEVMGLSEGKVGVVLYRTLRKLRKALEGEP